MNKLSNIYLTLFLFLMNTACLPEASELTSAPEYKIIGYVAGWQDLSVDDIEAEKLTHINYAFAKISANGNLEKITERDSLNLRKLVSLKERNPALKILISIGGWGAEYFSDAALTEASRLKFANSAVAFMKRHQLDGVDLDWEYPGQPGAGNIFRTEDKQNFTLMLKAMREQLDAQSTKDEREGEDKYLLTIATGGNPKYLEHTEMDKVQRYLDFLNIMTYDLYNAKVTGHHTGLYTSASDDGTKNSSADAVQGHIDAGVPAEKIVLGLAFYGRGWHGVNDQNNGLYQPTEGPLFSLSHDSLSAAFINKNGYTRYWDGDAKAPYLWNPVSHSFITYADEESFAHKTDFVRSAGLGGVMFWEYSHDQKEGVLLDKLYSELNKGSD